MKTTLEIRDDVYKKLVEASVDRYGNTKSISKMANELIEDHLKEIAGGKEPGSKKGRKPDIVERSFGSWKIKESGAEYVKHLRKGWSKRSQRLGV